jgi:hypothetical protein
MKRFPLPCLAAQFLSLGCLASLAVGADPKTDSPRANRADSTEPIGLFDAMEQGLVEAKFVARSAARGRIVMTNNTDKPLQIEIPEAFVGVPEALAQFGGGGGGGGLGGGGGGLGGGQQTVGGGGGGGGRGGGRGGGGFGGGGRGGGRGGAFSVPPEKVARVDVDLLCLDHGLRDPSSSKPYVIRPVENFVSDPAVVELLIAFGNGELPAGAAQAAAWHLHSGVSWNELAAKLTGTERHLVRHPYFSRAQLEAGMQIATRARQLGASRVLEPRPFKLPSEGIVEEPADSSPGEAESGTGSSVEEPPVEAEPEVEAS